MKEELLHEAIANYCTVHGCAHTMSSNYIFETSDLENKFELPEGYILEHAVDIEHAFNREIVAEVEIYQDKVDNSKVVDLTFYGNYCNVNVDFDY